MRAQWTRCRRLGHLRCHDVPVRRSQLRHDRRRVRGRHPVRQLRFARVLRRRRLQSMWRHASLSRRRGYLRPRDVSGSRRHVRPERRRLRGHHRVRQLPSAAVLRRRGLRAMRRNGARAHRLQHHLRPHDMRVDRRDLWRPRRRLRRRDALRCVYAERRQRGRAGLGGRLTLEGMRAQLGPVPPPARPTRCELAARLRISGRRRGCSVLRGTAGS